MSVVPNAQTSVLKFLGHSIGAPAGATGHKTPIIAELGINHNGDEDIAHKMIDSAADCGADIVKLQLRDLKTTYERRYIDHPDSAPGGLAHYLPVLKACALPGDAYERLKTHAEERKLGFLVTPFDLPSVTYLESMGVEAYKVASCDATNPLLLGRLARTQKPVLVSTGMTTEVQVLRMAAHLAEVMPSRYALMHAISGYPAAFQDCQLHMIMRYKVNCGVPVGWSGHELGVSVSVCAVAVGADILERHFTLDRTMKGPDHAASLEPDGLKKLVERVRAFEAAFGDPYLQSKGITRGEEATQEVLGKSLVAKRDLAKGETIGWADVEARSPGRGVLPLTLLEVGSTWRNKRAMAAGERFIPADFMPEPAEVTA